MGGDGHHPAPGGMGGDGHALVVRALADAVLVSDHHLEAGDAVEKAAGMLLDLALDDGVEIPECLDVFVGMNADDHAVPFLARAGVSAGPRPPSGKIGPIGAPTTPPPAQAAFARHRSTKLARMRWEWRTSSRATAAISASASSGGK